MCEEKCHYIKEGCPALSIERGVPSRAIFELHHLHTSSSQPTQAHSLPISPSRPVCSFLLSASSSSSTPPHPCQNHEHTAVPTPFLSLYPPHVWNTRVQWVRTLDQSPPSVLRPSRAGAFSGGDLLRVKSSHSPRLCFRDQGM